MADTRPLTDEPEMMIMRPEFQPGWYAFTYADGSRAVINCTRQAVRDDILRNYPGKALRLDPQPVFPSL